MPLRQAVAELLDRSGERDRWMLRIRSAWRAAYELGLAVGIDLGRRQEAAERDAAWHAIAAPIARGVPLTELERRRWGPRGRKHFADPRPGDFPGRGAA